MAEAAVAKKATRKKVEKKAPLKAVEKAGAVAAAEIIPKSEVVGMIDAEKLRDQARNSYLNFQKSWYEFAKVVAKIHDDDVWTALGYENFKAYCQEEFRDMGYSTIVKFIQVVKSWGKEIEARLKKDPNQFLPSYETCYTLTASEDKFDKAEVPKLRKQVLDGKITVRDMRERVASLKGDVEKREDDAAAKRIQKDIDNAQPLSVKLAEGKGVDDALELIDSKVDFLIENLPLITKALKEPTELLVNIATKIQDTLIDETLGEFLDKVGEVCGEEGDE